MTDASRLSVVMPALDEAAMITEALTGLQALRVRGGEVIVVDGGSSDETRELADPLADRVLSSPPGRARQMNAGWRAARGELVWFVHADSRVGEAHWQALLAHGAAGEAWGWFDVRFDSPRWIFSLIAALMNRRARWTRVATGDQGLFASRALLEASGGFPDIPLMEDLALCRLLRGRARGRALTPPLATSARRWEGHGVARTILLMWALRAAYALGADPAHLARRYRHAR